MHVKHLLLPSAKTAVLVPAALSYAHYVRYAAVGGGFICVPVGAADVSARLARAAFGERAALVAFAPAVTLPAGGQGLNAGAVGISTPGVLLPARLRIPSLSVNAAVEPVGKKADGSMGTPKDFDDISWYSPGAKPGEAGSAVFAGHVNNGLLKSGVFERLSPIQKGDYVLVDDASGRSKIYRVYSVETYEPNAPTDALFATTGQEQLVLITCDGAWVPKAKTFDKRLVIVARPVF